MSVTVSDDVSHRLDELISLHTEKIHDILGLTIVNEIQDIASNRIKKKGSTYIPGIRYELVSNGVFVHDSHKHGIYLEEGTRAHMVKPKTKQALHWRQDGAIRFSKVHRVSGVVAKRMFRDGIKQGKPKAVNAIIEYLVNRYNS